MIMETGRIQQGLRVLKDTLNSLRAPFDRVPHTSEYERMSRAFKETKPITKEKICDQKK